MDQSLATILVAILGILAAYLTIRVQSLNQEKLKLKESINQNKEKLYQELLDFLFDVIEEDDKLSESEKTEKAKSFLRKMIYVSSPKVLKSFGDFMQSQYNDKDPNGFIARKLMAELIVRIRKDLGLRSIFSRESWLDVMRIYIRDIHMFVPRHYANARRTRSIRPTIIINGEKIK